MTPEDRIHALGIWHGPLEIEPITGGITNRNYLVRDRSTRRVVRLGDDIPVHHINRQNELAASIAAHAAGLSPAVIHHAPENSSNEVRWVYVCQWLPADVRYTGAPNHRTDGLGLKLDQPFDHPFFPRIET